RGKQPVSPVGPLPPRLHPGFALCGARAGRAPPRVARHMLQTMRRGRRDTQSAALGASAGAARSTNAADAVSANRITYRSGRNGLEHALRDVEVRVDALHVVQLLER